MAQDIGDDSAAVQNQSVESGADIGEIIVTARKRNGTLVKVPVAITAVTYKNRYHFLLYFRDFKITASHEYLDSLYLTDVFFDGARPE